MPSQTDERPIPFTIDMVRILADFTIRRGAGFALLGVCCVMLAFAFDLRLAFHAGAVLVAFIAVALWLKALRAPHKPYFQTELWIMLPERPSMGKPELQRLIGSILAERFWWHAKVAAALAGGFAAISLAIGLGRLL